MRKIIFTVVLFFLSAPVYSLCDQSYLAKKEYYEKRRILQLQIIQEMNKKADSILVARVIDIEYGDTDQDIIVDLIRIKVLENFKGNYSVGEVMTKNTHEQRDREIIVCGDLDPDEERRVIEMKPGFKYLVYLNKDKILRANEFHEWPYHVEPEEELELIK